MPHPPLLPHFPQAAGLALFALAVWVTVDSYGLYPLAKWSGKDDIFTAAWIAIFTGFFFFCTCVFGIAAALKRSRAMMMTYLLVMLIIYIFECASCITSVVHRDYMVNSNLIKKQMLTYYTANGDAGTQITLTWNRIMTQKGTQIEATKFSDKAQQLDFCSTLQYCICALTELSTLLQAQCCGTDGPLDWVQYNSTFNQNFGSSILWPLNCCQQLNNYQPLNLPACKLGLPDSVFTKGCFSHIQWVLNTYTWAISWYGFSVLMFVFLVLLLSMLYYITL
ncbi:uroplakin-1a [Aplochiton taeniatus]